MSKLRYAIQALVLITVTLAFASLAQAQATRTWVSGVGDDVNPCSRTAPCKTFAGAISKTAIAGEIDCLDPGGFGAVTITKSITIDGGGTFASVLASGTTGVNVTITTTTTADPKQHVILRRLSINGTGTSTCSGSTCGLPTGIRAINFTAGKKLSVESCVIMGFVNEGIRASLTASGSNLFIKDTNITNCATGINLTTSSGNLVAIMDNVKLEGMTNGLVMGANANGTLRNSSVMLNTGVGVTMGSAANISIEHTVINHNGTGLQPGAGSQTDLSNTTIIGNGSFGISNSGGTVFSHGNNQFNLNGGGAGNLTPTPINQQ
ncbi:MAG: right-handed parallel beta-helix repeat-containing protein [Pyrinomonadaceae bacterium]